MSFGLVLDHVHMPELPLLLGDVGFAPHSLYHRFLFSKIDWSCLIYILWEKKTIFNKYTGQHIVGPHKIVVSGARMDSTAIRVFAFYAAKRV